ncbi:hypothetical protein [Buchnera aphidicola]|uniref:hypothetical protein n=1 Tax=Buchnera aphidicola TaxID=9 RepID=UPI001E4B013A|nr:hypothetical protein [Buchnera aphidicola]
MDNSIKYEKSISGSINNQVNYASNMISIEFSLEILKNIPVYILIENDACLSFDVKKCIQKFV